jgi:hypothetical protein
MRLNEVYRNSGLGKWFHGESANKTPGWDRYNSSGKRVGECGDAKKGDPYSACLSKQKAEKLGKEGIASFVKRKRAAQSEAGRGEKGTGSKGKKPIFVKTGASEKRKVEEQMEPIKEGCGCEKTSLFGKIKDKMKKKLLKEEAPLNKPFRTPGGPKKFGVRVKNEKGNIITVRFGDPNMEIKRDDPKRRSNFRARHGCDNPGPKTKARYWSCRMWEKGKPVSKLVKEHTDFTEIDLSSFLNKKVLIESHKGSHTGILGTAKGKYCLLENGELKTTFEPYEITKVICEGKKVLILEKNVPNDSEAWSDCKAQAKKKFDVYPCVPLDSLAISKKGPVSYNEVKLGEEILTYNIQNKELEWKPVKNVHYFEKAPLVQMGKSTGFQIKCTPNHKWVVNNGSNYSNTSLVETKDINSHMQLITCSSLNNSDEILLENWSKKDSWVEKVISMSKNQREIFLASAIVYDGHDKGISTKISGRHTFGFSQKNEDHFYATILAAYLNGYHVSFFDKNPEMQAATIIRNKNNHNTQNLIIKDTEPEDVWCPETENNTWVMIQNGFITITGNSAYANAWAAKCYKKKGGTWKKMNEDVQNISETIVKRDDKWVLMNKAGTKVLGTHPSREAALKQERAIQVSKRMHEETDLILAEKLKNCFFGDISEDIVNPDNKGKLTPQRTNPRAKSRDRIREKVKDRSKVVTGPKDKNGNKLRDDTPEEASYRLATYIELKGKNGGKKDKKKNNK